MKSSTYTALMIATLLAGLLPALFASVRRPAAKPIPVEPERRDPERP